VRTDGGESARRPRVRVDIPGTTTRSRCLCDLGALSARTPGDGGEGERGRFPGGGPPGAFAFMRKRNCGRSSAGACCLCSAPDHLGAGTSASRPTVRAGVDPRRVMRFRVRAAGAAPGAEPGAAEIRLKRSCRSRFAWITAVPSACPGTAGLRDRACALTLDELMAVKRAELLA
jgi:hypothetical protein